MMCMAKRRFGGSAMSGCSCARRHAGQCFGSRPLSAMTDSSPRQIGVPTNAFLYSVVTVLVRSLVTSSVTARPFSISGLRSVWTYSMAGSSRPRIARAFSPWSSWNLGYSYETTLPLFSSENATRPMGITLDSSHTLLRWMGVRIDSGLGYEDDNTLIFGHSVKSVLSFERVLELKGVQSGSEVLADAVEPPVALGDDVHGVVGHGDQTSGLVRVPALLERLRAGLHTALERRRELDAAR